MKNQNNMTSNIYNPVLKETRKVAENTYEVTFNFNDKNFDFAAGEYVTITLFSLGELPTREQYRDFSILSSPTELPLLAIAIRNSSSHFKKTLLALPIGNPVILEGPKGIFTLPNTTATPLIFVAGGIGITPFMSMIRFLTNKKIPYEITLFYYNRNRDTAAYLTELEEYRSFVRLVLVFGLITEENFSPDRHALLTSLIYIAGPPGMVKETRKILSQLQVNEKQIRTEEFTGYE